MPTASRLLLFSLLLTSSAALGAPSKQYSVPWQLRPTAAGNVVRSDTAFAFYEGADGEGAFTTASMLFGSYKVLPNLAPFARLGVVYNQAGGDGGVTLVNPAVGATYGLQLSDELRLGLFLGLTVPVGMGGGNDADAEQAATTRSGILARSAMDNAMFAVNDFTVFPGVGLSWNRGPFTVQAEVTVLQLTRVKGELKQADSAKTNFTSGLHLGWFASDTLSVGAELRYQRWLSTPAAVTTEKLRDNLTVAAGPRFHLKVGDLVLRPGMALVLPLDTPMSRQEYKIVQLDVPVAF